MVFNLEEYKGKYCMHCATIFEANSFTNYMHTIGKKWNGGNRYALNTAWNAHKEDTVYLFNEGGYASVEYAREDGYAILEWKDYMYDSISGVIHKDNWNDPRSVTIGLREFFKIPEAEENGVIPIVMKGYYDSCRFGNSSNDFTESTVLAVLSETFLPSLEQELGEDNIVEFETDLTTLNGRHIYENIKSKISLPTFDFYRKHIDTFDLYNEEVRDYWWLATPYDGNKQRLCVADSNGDVYYSAYNYRYALRPILYVKAEALKALTTQN
jgi:hypothetical protein